ncbi:MAG: hypothetical protein RQM92_11285 [Candidatus Syntrophopropionicum ammoniitolerans]
MQRKWLIPLVVCILLVVAWCLRWEQGPTQTENELQIIHLKDRWTGQAWISTYGRKRYILYSGEQNPVPTQNDISFRKSQILGSPEKVQEIQAIEQKIEFYNQEITAHEEGHREYERLVTEKVKRDFVPIYGRPLFNAQVFDISIDEALKSGEYNDEIPRDILEHHWFWSSAKENLEYADNELANLPLNQSLEARSQAELELEAWAWQERKIATGIWVGLFILSLLTMGLFSRNNFKKPTLSDTGSPYRE